jgi:hypothetical protein
VKFSALLTDCLTLSAGSFPHKNNCTLHGAAGGHIVGISYRISHSDLGITENISFSVKKYLQILVPNGIFSVDR